MTVRSCWRWPAGVLTGAALGAVVGAWEAAACAGPGEKLAAGILGAGLVSAMGLALGIVTALVFPLVLGRDPASAIGKTIQLHRDDPDAASGFLTRSVLGQLAAIIWMTTAFHGARISLSVFHHMGLASLLLSVALTLLALFLWLSVGWASKHLERKLVRRLPGSSIAKFALGSLLLSPVVVGAMILFSPDHGEGPIAYLGLLQREELEIGFAFLALVPLLGTVVVATSLTRKWAIRVIPPIFLVAGFGIACAVVGTTNWNSSPDAAFAVETKTSLGSRVLAMARRITDRDGDGASPLFGGGDCDDGDPDRWPGAIDLPSNGIDEDCSGKDSVRRAVAPPKKVEVDSSSIDIPENLSLLIISVDAMRWDLISADYERNVTPNLDRLAKRGIVFEKTYALSSFTGRAIAPIFTGRYPTETYCDTRHLGVYSGKNQMLAETLKEASFSTASVQAHPYFKHSGMDQGFETWDIVIPPGDESMDRKFTSPAIASRAIELLGDDAITAERFFIWSHMMDPHKQYLPHKGFDFGEGSRARYDGEIAFVDHHVGKILDKLEERGLTDRTVILITSDHGEAFGEHDIYFHGRRLWEEVVRVPMIWVVPGIEPRRVKGRVSHVDIAATAYDLLGVKPPTEAGGTSLLPMMTGDEEGDRRVYIEQPLGEYMPAMFGLVDGGYKLIHSIAGNRYQLFDLETDPGEKNDLARSEPEKLDELKQVYQDLRGSLERNADVWKRE